jgi:hypothetical protein
MASIFQPRFGEDRYPVGRFILERSRALGITRSDLVRRLGYRDIGSGHRALSEVLLTGVMPRHVAKHLANALDIEDALVESVIGATTLQKCDEPTSPLSDRICRFRQSAQCLRRSSSRRC